jgi:endonuclease/exonuclease/phosphatase family metal-dependent hydrolase
MRWLIALAALFVWAASAAEITVATWNLKWFPSGTPLRATEEEETERIHEAVAVFKPISADIIVLQEVRDFATCHRLAKEIGSLKVVICSQFQEFGGTVGWQQLAILSKEEAVAAWSENWKSTGASDPPRGFAFAHFRFGTNDVAVYVVHLKSNLLRGSDEREMQLNILKREIASEQIIHHLNETEKLLREEFEVVVVAGDFNTDKNQFPSEATLGNLAQAGFRSGFENVPLELRVTHPGAGRFPDATFDYVFVRGCRTAKPPVILSSALSDHYPVIRTLVLP